MTRVVRVSVIDPSGRAGDDAREIDLDTPEETPPSATAAIATQLAAARDGRRRIEVVVDGWRFELEVEDAARARLRRRATSEPDAEPANGPAQDPASNPR